ncbi:ribbon-helix-helix domain-containing protein [Magnetospira thiophila]
MIFRCDPILREELDRTADAMNMSSSAAMRVALQSFVRKHMTKLDAAMVDKDAMW